MKNLMAQLVLKLLICKEVFCSCLDLVFPEHELWKLFWFIISARCIRLKFIALIECFIKQIAHISPGTAQYVAATVLITYAARMKGVYGVWAQVVHEPFVIKYKCDMTWRKGEGAVANHWNQTIMILKDLFKALVSCSWTEEVS